MRRTGIAVLASLTAVVPCTFIVTTAEAAGEFTVSPTNLSFPATYAGDTASLTVTVTNTSSSTLTPNFAGGAPNDSTNFGGSQNCAGLTFAPGDSCEFTYTFEPASPGSHSTSTAIAVDSDNFAISMSGNALDPIDLSPTTLVFPDTAIGDASSLEVIVTNLSPVSQTPNYAGGAPNDPTNFGGSQSCGGVTLSAGATCVFTYTFTPTTAGPLSTTTTIDVGGTSHSISMSGNGVDPTSTTTTTTTPTETTTTLPANGTGAADTTEPAASTTTPLTTTAVSTTPPVLSLPGSAVPGPIVDGDAEVIAQGIVDVPAGPVGWGHQPFGPGGWPLALTDGQASFLEVDGPDAVLVSGPRGSAALLGAGEAQFLPAAFSGSATPTFDGAVAVARRITLTVNGGSTTFAPGPARRDVNLIRGVLAPDETLTVSSPFPVLIIVVDGDLVIGDIAMPAGTSTTMGSTSPDPSAPNPTELHNNGDTDAIVLVAAVGATVP